MILRIFLLLWHLLITQFISLWQCSLCYLECESYFMCSTQAVWRQRSCVVPVPLWYCDYISATWASLCNACSRGRKAETPWSILYVTVTWMSAAHITCPGPVSSVQTLAPLDKDKPQPSLTWQSSGLCKSLIWHSCLTLNGVFLFTWQRFSQCYDHKLFMLCGTIREMHI